MNAEFQCVAVHAIENKATRGLAECVQSDTPLTAIDDAFGTSREAALRWARSSAKRASDAIVLRFFALAGAESVPASA